MSFGSPHFLFLALLTLLVVLLHTLHRQRRPVGSVLLWRQLALDARPRRSLRLPKPNLPLLLQMLAVLAIALALAEPRWGTGERVAVHHVYLLDISASMGTADVGDADTRLDAARAALDQELGQLVLLEGDRVSVLTVGSAPRPLVVRHDSVQAARELMPTLTVTGGTADWRAAAALLPAILTGAAEPKLTILTDDPPEPALFASDLAPRVVGFGDPTTPNAAVMARLAPDPESPGTWRLDGRVVLRGLDAAPDLTLRFRPDGREGFLTWEAPLLGPLEGDAQAFSVGLDLPGPGLIELALPADAAPYDDRQLLVVPDPTARLQVLYLGPGNPALLAALQAGGRAEVLAATALPVDLSGYDLVVLDRAVVPQRPQGNLMWLGPARVEGEPTPVLRPASVNSWNGEHALARGLGWASLGPLQAFDGAGWPGSQVLLAAGDLALIEARTGPNGRELRITIDPGDPAWTGAPQFPLLIGNLLDWFAPPPGACIAGQVCPLPESGLVAPIMGPDDRLVFSPALADADPVPEVLSGGFVPLREGLYDVRGRVIAVNADPTESVPAASIPAPAPVSAATSGWPMSRWLLVLALALILMDAALALANPPDRRLLAARTSEGRRQRLALGLRGGTLLLGLAALIDLPFPQPRPAEQVVLVAPTLDPVSAVAPLLTDMAAACAAIIDQAAGLVTPGAPPLVARDLSCDADPGLVGLPSGAVGWDLGLALELAVALMQPGDAGRVVLAGDAPQTSGAPMRGVEALLQGGVRLDLLPLPRPVRGDAWVSDISVPSAIFAGDTAPLTAIVHSDSDLMARVDIGQDDRVIVTEDIALVAGPNRIDSTIQGLTEGTVRFWVRVTAPGDPQPQNDLEAVRQRVVAAPRIAIVTRETDRGQIMADALALQGLNASVLRPDRAPFRMSGWLDYDGVMLMNVPALDLDTRQQEQLAEFAGLHGRGLMILGGENSFGPGGYFRTPLEDVSPLSAQVPREAPVAAIVFVLDRSGSMQAPVEGVTRLDIARQATLSAIGLLNAESQVAIVVFDSEARVLLPLQDRLNLSAAEAALAPLDPGGGTSIAPGLAAGLDELERADAAIRHIVVMSDGLSQPGDFDGLMARAAAAGITVSTVSIGDGADVGRLADLARAGGGSSHVTRDFRALPGILSQEAMMLGGEPMEQGPVAVFWDDRAEPWLSSLPQMPPVDSWVRTSLKPGAHQHLALTDATGEVMPLLASWRYGNGTVLALASHAVGPGTQRWQMQAFFPLLYAQAMRAMLAGGDEGLSVEVRRLGDTLSIRAAALTDEAEPIPDAPLTATVRQGDVAVPVRLLPGVGGWVGQTARLAPGDWQLQITGDGIAAEAVGTIAYSTVLDHSRADPSLAESLSDLTGGRVLAEGAAFPWPRQVLRLAPGWQAWGAVALAAFLLDLAGRYAPGLLGGVVRSMGLGRPQRRAA